MTGFLRCLVFVVFLLAGGLLCVGSSALGAGTGDAKVAQGKSSVSMDFGLKAGYRIDQLDWNIAGSSAGTNPNILSELTWDDLEIYQVQFESELTAGNRRRSGYLYHLRAMLGLGAIFDGANRDSDYAGDNRTLEFSRTDNAADDGGVFDFSVGAGLEFRDRSSGWTLLPLLGFSYHRQDLQITDGRQTVSEQAIADGFFGPGEITMPPEGPIAGLDSRYAAEWYGPWLGLELRFQPVERWQISGTVEYHLVEYFGEADWNLRTDLDHPASFRHWAEGTGLSFGMELSGRLNQIWTCDLTATYQQWQADDGTDVTYLANGSRAGTRFNEVNWESLSMMVGLSRRF